MTRPVDPHTDKLPESTVEELHAVYRAGSLDEPSPALDLSILEAARAELRADRVIKRPAPWWKRWLVPATGIAVGILGLSLTWRIMDEQELDLRREMNAAGGVSSAAAGANKGTMAPVEPSAVSEPSVKVPAPSKKSRAAESAPVQSPPSPAPAQAVKETPGAAPQALIERQRATNGDAEVIASSPAAAKGPLETKRSDAMAASESVASAPAELAARLADDAATPQAWLKHIRELQSAGRLEDAAQSLARFRARYPEQVVPKDLNALK